MLWNKCAFSATAVAHVAKGIIVSNSGYEWRFVMVRKTVNPTIAPQGKAVKQMRPESEVDFKKLQHILDAAFNLQEQDDLCRALKIASPRVPGQTKNTRAANIIKAVVNADRLPDLTAFISRVRAFYAEEIAQFNLPDHAAEYSLDFLNDANLPCVRSIRLAEQLACHAKAQALRDLCFDLEIDYENLGGLNHRENVQNLVAIIESRDELDVLLKYLNEKWPSIEWLEGA